MGISVAAQTSAPPFAVGQLVEGKGIYLGAWKPTDKNGESLGKVFDLYAAPENLSENGDNLLLTFNNAARHVAGLKNFHGHDGGDLASEKDILEAARNNPAALENWFIPTRGMLDGKKMMPDGKDAKIQAANLCDVRSEGSFKGMFAARRRQTTPVGLWSCTQHPQARSVFSPYVFAAMAAHDYSNAYDPDYLKFATRAVRAELRL